MVKHRHARLVRLRVLVWCLAAVCYAVSPCSGLDSDHICQTSNLNPGGVGSTGNITSPRFPAYAPGKGWARPYCRLALTACAHCKIHITYLDIVLPECRVSTIPIGSCVHECDHLFLYEPDYPEATAQYVFGDSTNLHSYTSISSRLNIVFCRSVTHLEAKRRFRIRFEIQEKYTVITGLVGGRNEAGHFTSPNFPHRYSLRNEVYTFLIQNQDVSGLIKLGFDDWSMSPNSIITIYFSNTTHPDGYVKRKGHGDRPFVLSNGPSLFVKFEAGEDPYAIPYVGFKANYQFVTEPFWPDKPYTVCGDYFYSLFGGHFSFDTRRCWPGDRVDCIWVVTKYRDHNHDQVAMKIQKFSVVPGLDSLEVRAGNTSEGLLLGQFDHSNLTGREFVSEAGFYLRLRATCTNAREFHAVFASFTNATDDGCEYYYHHKCGNGRCISKSLLCDGIDHCGDSSDEGGCTTVLPTTPKSCSTKYACHSGTGGYCITDRCDGHLDCADGTDEQGCWIADTPRPSAISVHTHWGTYIPIGLVSILLAIISCIVISCCARRKRSMIRRRQRAMASSRLPTISATLPGRQHRSSTENHLNFNVNIHTYPDVPPTYDEAIMVSPSYEGIYNMGYSRSDSSDPLPRPPPYSAHDMHPYPMMPPGMGPQGGGLVNAPSTPRYTAPPPPVPASPHISLTQLALTGSADLGGTPVSATEGPRNVSTSLDNPDTGRGHHDPSRRRGRNHATMGSQPANRHSSRRTDNRGGASRATHSHDADHERDHSRPSGRSRSGRHCEAPQEAGPGREMAERRPSSTSQVQAFVQNLINMAAYRSGQGLQQPSDGINDRVQRRLPPPPPPPPPPHPPESPRVENLILSQTSPDGLRRSAGDTTDNTSSPGRSGRSTINLRTQGHNEQNTRATRLAGRTHNVAKDSLDGSHSNQAKDSSRKSRSSKSDENDNSHNRQSGSHSKALPAKRDSQDQGSCNTSGSGDHGNQDARRENAALESHSPPEGSSDPVVNLAGADDSMTFV